jgi:hypothetical protein
MGVGSNAERSTKEPDGGGQTVASDAVSPEVSVPKKLDRPKRSNVELGVLVDRSEAEVRAWTDHRERVAAAITGRLCGDDQTCGAVRAAVRDEASTGFRVMPASDWNLGRLDVDASASGLTASDRQGFAKRSRVVVVSTSMPTSTDQLSIRAALAATAVIAEALDGLVHDPLLVRIERPKDFAAHAIVTPLGGATFRRDRVEILYEPKSEGVVRVLTAGLSRWGSPDVEASRVPTGAQARVADLVLGVAEAVAQGSAEASVTLGIEDLVRAAGIARKSIPEGVADGEQAPENTIQLGSVNPESGDPNDFMARILPPDGDGPMGYLALAEHFFGRVLGASTDRAAANPGQRREARRGVDEALARWGETSDAGGKLLVRLPFDILGDAGVEAMWVEVTDFNDKTVTGSLVDEPLAAVTFSRGQSVTRRRDEVEAVTVRGTHSLPKE